ncbi:DUF1684 domain-containing protein [Flavobacterium sp.]|uniref:DUF1684 domain-containing protein n=1 Tax=Flavobacterium sp. TaxID=239 RepID=UPI00263474F7|nr:DUF1684 domain-containing protein [Flavobacterium sp.]
MKNLFLVLVFFITLSSSAQCSKHSVLAFQKKINSEYADKKETPLKEKDLAAFVGLHFYPVNLKLCVKAGFVRTPNEKPFAMPTSGTRTPMYVKYGEAHFSIDGKKMKLNIYQNIELAKTQEYKNHLFLPFTDLTSGVESYGGGRYIDLEIPKGKTIDIDFNKAYNPYCAYNEKYSCPIPPKENDLHIEVLAGVKKFHD